MLIVSWGKTSTLNVWSLLLVKGAGEQMILEKAAEAVSFSPPYFLFSFFVLIVSCYWHQHFHFKWCFNIDIPLRLPFFLGLTFAWQMVQMAQQIFTGSVLEKKRKQSKTKQNKTTPAARLMTCWHHTVCHQSPGWGKHHRKIIDVELAGFFRVSFESCCLEHPPRGGARAGTLPLPSQTLPFSHCLGEKEVLWQINVFPFQIKTGHSWYQNYINYRKQIEFLANGVCWNSHGKVWDKYIKDLNSDRSRERWSMLRITYCHRRHLLGMAYHRKSRAVKYLPNEVAF